MAAEGFGAQGAALRVGVVGCGTVGSAVCSALDARLVHAYLHALNDIDAGKVDAALWSLKYRCQSMTLPGVVATCDLVVEATNPQAAPDIIRQALDGGRDVVVTNPAALVGREDFVQMASERGARLHLSCDILVGLDGVRAAAGAGTRPATLTVTGPPAFFASQPAGQQSQADLESLAEPAEVLRSTGADALQALPELANAIAALGYAGSGFGQMTVVARADPTAQDLACRIEVACPQAEISAESRLPLLKGGLQASPLVALSAVAALRRAVESLVVG